MGFDVNGVRALLVARSAGVRFAETMTVGRQRLHVDFALLKGDLEFFGIKVPDHEINRLLTEADRYCEPFLKRLDARVVQSIDASSYEGASVIHDMNRPIGHNLKNAFSVVIDSGSLEHVFHFPQAIKNCMEMIKVGGHFLGIVPVNNFMGHGFYQFSPELYFRVFDRENGFVMERLMLYESVKNSTWTDCPDPKVIRKRVELVNSRPTFMFVIARKTAEVQIFSSVPQQSDYATQWNSFGRSGS